MGPIKVIYSILSLVIFNGCITSKNVQIQKENIEQEKTEYVEFNLHNYSEKYNASKHYYSFKLPDSNSSSLILSYDIDRSVEIKADSLVVKNKILDLNNSNNGGIFYWIGNKYVLIKNTLSNPIDKFALLSLFDTSYIIENNKVNSVVEKNDIDIMLEYIQYSTGMSINKSIYADIENNYNNVQNQWLIQGVDDFHIFIDMLNNKKFYLHKNYPFDFIFILYHSGESFKVPCTIRVSNTAMDGIYDIEVVSNENNKIPTLPINIKGASVRINMKSDRNLNILSLSWKKRIVNIDNFSKDYDGIVYSGSYLVKN